ncbi:MAG TPA: hypothetical protein VFM40_07635 [Actinomycetota bacterium]|nr:hypothetical protein [Actinomycetota bacterium]
MKRALAALVVAALLAISASSALAGGGRWAVRVRGSDARAVVTYGTWAGTTEVHVTLPWRHRVPVSGFQVVTVEGHRERGGPGKIVCEILHGTRVVARTVGRGPYAVCQTSAGTS